MPSLRAQQLGFAFQSVPVFEPLSFHLDAPWTGIVGGNGLGKTTLLRLFSGELTPQSGALKLEPQGARVVLCAQRAEERPSSLESVAWAADRLARRLRAQLRLNPDTLERWDSMSPGERKRWQLGTALYEEPDVLLLDEPGNHLDMQGLAWLREALRDFGGLGVIVSHDRALLDAVTQATLHLEPSGARLWPHSFSEAQKLWLAEAEARRLAHSETKRSLQKEQRQLATKRRTLADTTRQRNTRVRMKDKNDSDARSLLADGKAEMGERAHAAALRRVKRRVENVSAQLEAIHVDDVPGQALFLRYQPSSKPTVVQFRGDMFAGERPLLRDASLQLGRNQRLWLRGPNGCGKSTLLKQILAQNCSVPEEKRLVLPQELTLEDSLDDLEAVTALAPEEKGKVLQLVHALGVEPDQLLRSAAPSPGEGRKLRLALGLGAQAWLAALDEPTHHLDLPAIERLETALRAFPGALLLITHDERLAQNCADEPADLAWTPATVSDM